MLPNDTEDQVVFMGWQDYLPLFSQLGACVRSTPTVFYNSAKAPFVKHCHLRRFETTTRNNWHYECANVVIDDSIVV
jgi:hypothetical protein